MKKFGLEARPRRRFAAAAADASCSCSRRFLQLQQTLFVLVVGFVIFLCFQIV
jgi:hypothetical protein